MLLPTDIVASLLNLHAGFDPGLIPLALADAGALLPHFSTLLISEDYVGRPAPLGGIGVFRFYGHGLTDGLSLELAGCLLLIRDNGSHPKPLVGVMCGMFVVAISLRRELYVDRRLFVV